MNHHFKKESFLFTLLIYIQFTEVRGQDESPPPPPPPEGGGGDAPAGGDAAAGGGGGNATSSEEPKTEFMSPAPWIRICGPGSGKYIGATSPSKDECPAGYWFKEPTKVGCVCGHGVWVFAKGWCDHTAKIIVAYNGSCFNINQDVKYVRHLGWNNNAFLPFHFVGTTGMEFVQDVPAMSTMSTTGTYFHKEYSQHIGAVFRDRAVEALTSRFCASPEPMWSKMGNMTRNETMNITRTFAMKYFVPKLPFTQKRVCFAYPGQNMQRFEYDAGYELNEGLSLMDGPPTTPFTKAASWATAADAKKCEKECVSPTFFTPNPSRNQSLLPDYMDPIYDEYFLEELKEMGLNSSAPIPEIMPEQNCTRIYALTNKTTAEIKEQTKRMIQYNLASSLMNELSPGIKFIDYKLMQKARVILSKVCPESELSSTILTGMLRMFRVALNESFFHYPFNQLGDDEETMNLLEILDTCATDAKEMEFQYQTKNDSMGDGNSTDNSTVSTTATTPTNLNATETCETGKFVGINYAFNEVNRTIMAKMPCHLRANITDLDLAVETAWKTVMFTHYYCARHFGNHSSGFSIFEQKLERFFNRWMQHRWFYPGPSNKAYQYIYQMYNLTQFVISLDRCVAAARSFSVYRKWIQRPVYSKILAGKLFEEQYDIPDDIAGRTSLDAINPKLNKFGKKAYCLPYWHAPASNPGLDYNPDSEYKPGCVKYKREEWQSPFVPKMKMTDGWRNTIDIF